MRTAVVVSCVPLLPSGTPRTWRTRRAQEAKRHKCTQLVNVMALYKVEGAGSYDSRATRRAAPAALRFNRVVTKAYQSVQVRIL